MKRLVAFLLLLCACTAAPVRGGGDAGSVGDEGPDAGSDAGVGSSDGDGGAPQPCGVSDVPGAFEGVHLTVTSDRCTYHSGEAATFQYRVDVDPSAPTVHVTDSSAGGPCPRLSSDPTSFVEVQVVPMTGTDPHYCLCDEGLCAQRQPADIDLARGPATGTFEWPGRAWNGPSDTGNPYGAPFPPGNYEVSIAFRSGGQGDVVAKLPITIVP